MSGSLAHGSNAEPNLTPMLDMVFQLVTFFMLVINFKAAAIDLSVQLPVIGSAAPVDANGKDDTMVLNIDKEGRLKVYGEAKEDIEQYVKREAQASLIRAHIKHPDLQEGDELPSIVVVRADKRTPFKAVNRVIEACKKNGYHTFSMKAMNRTM